jgi:hypothetical protein
LILLIALLTGLQHLAQNDYLDADAEDNEKTYKGGSLRSKNFQQNLKSKKTKKCYLFYCRWHEPAASARRTYSK